MEGILAAASGRADLEGFKEAHRAHQRALLAPALVAAVTALVEGGAGGDAAGAIACIKYSLENGACLDARKEEGGDAALSIAAEAGRLDAVNAMLEHWCSVDTEDGRGGRSGGPDVINAVGGGHGGGALQHAAKEGHVQVVTALAGATGRDGVAVDLNVVNTHGTTALIFAASNGHGEVVTVLVGATGKDGVAVDLNVANKDGITALHCAADKGYAGIVTVLIGATGKDGVAVDLNVVAKHGVTALHCAASNGHDAVVTALVGATGKDGVAVDLNIADKDGQTALLRAALNGHAGVVTVLVGATGKDGVAADLNVADEDGWTALLLAAANGDAGIVTALLSATGKDGVAVDLNVANKHGNTALLCAASNGHGEVVTLLVGATGKDGVAVDLHAVDKYGNTALLLAADNGHDEILIALLGATGKDGVAVDLNVADKHGDTALLYAAANGDAGIVTALLGATGKDGVAVDLNVADKDGRTALLLAASRGYAGIVTALLDAQEHNARIATALDVSTKDNVGHTAHHYASTAHPGKFTPEILARLLSPPPPCPKPAATAFVESLGIHDIYLNPEFNRCYCRRCYKGPATISNEGPTPYVVPEPGWVRFGLTAGPRAQAMDVFRKWSACFHGVKSSLVLNSILDHGGLMKPGSVLLDGTKLESTKCAGRQDEVVYTSPTIKYAGLKFYAEPIKFTTAAGVEMRGSIAFQCRQNPATLEKQGETMAYRRKMPGHLDEHCPNVNLAEIEWKTEAERSVIPYGLLVRVWRKGKDLDAEAYSSPVDGAGKWWAKEEQKGRGHGRGQGRGGGGGGAADGGK